MHLHEIDFLLKICRFIFNCVTAVKTNYTTIIRSRCGSDRNTVTSIGHSTAY